MLAFFGNLAPMEIGVVLILAILVFGGRLPEVAGQAFGQVRRFRRALDDMRRDTGIDRELRDLQNKVYEAERPRTPEYRLEADENATPVEGGGADAGGDDGDEAGEEPAGEAGRHVPPPEVQEGGQANPSEEDGPASEKRD